MCKSASEGGQRCAAYSRPRYEATPRTDPVWIDVARDYASTAEGHARLTEETELARLAGDIDTEALLRTALLRGEALRAANAEAARLIGARRRRTLGQDEIEQVMAEFGVSTEQVLRDHGISHVLGILTRIDHGNDLTFFGGTALSRTYLPTLRLSEDIDLIARGPRAEIAAARIERAVVQGLRRTHGNAAWASSLVAAKGSDAAVLQVGERIKIRVQLLSADGYSSWPTERRQLIQRYADAPAATLTTLTAPAFAANKAAAWCDRRAPRDLYDLWALGEYGHITAEAGDLFKRLGPTGNFVQPWMFAQPPSEEAWHDALGHQGIIRISAGRALAEVREMWRRVTPQGI